MTLDLRFWWSRLNANYWFYPALFTALSVLLAMACIWADRNGWAAFLNDVSWVVPARPQGASDMLQVIAGSTIAVASTVFSITIVAVSFASGTYGPRLLTNFMEDKGNQLSLATFIGTFVYALVVLRSVRAENESTANDAVATALPGFVPQLSLLVAFALMAVSVAVLVFFLNHIPSSIRINKVIHGIGARLIRAIATTYPEEGGNDGPAHRPRGKPLRARKPGYIRLIDFADFQHLAAEGDFEVTLLVRTGDFVHTGMPMAEIANGDASDEVIEHLHACYTQGFSRTPEQDPEFLIDELVEIGLRALSPGINDPFTAVTALHWLGAATADLGRRRLVKDVAGNGNAGSSDSDHKCRVHPVADDFRHFVQRGFGALRSAVATSPIASKIMLDALRDAAITLDARNRRELLLGEAAQLREQARLALEGPDRREVEDRFDAILDDFTRD